MHLLFLQNWSNDILDKYKVKISPKAMRELNNIYEYIAKEKLDPENAKGQTDRIKRAILCLDIFILLFSGLMKWLKRSVS